MLLRVLLGVAIEAKVQVVVHQNLDTAADHAKVVFEADFPVVPGAGVVLLHRILVCRDPWLAHLGEMLCLVGCDGFPEPGVEVDDHPLERPVDVGNQEDVFAPENRALEFFHVDAALVGVGEFPEQVDVLEHALAHSRLTCHGLDAEGEPIDDVGLVAGQHHVKLLAAVFFGLVAIQRQVKRPDLLAALTLHSLVVACELFGLIRGVDLVLDDDGLAGGIADQDIDVLVLGLHRRIGDVEPLDLHRTQEVLEQFGTAVMRSLGVQQEGEKARVKIDLVT